MVGGYGRRLWGVTCCRISLFHLSLGSVFRSWLVTNSRGVRFGGCLVLHLYTVQLRIVVLAFLITWAPLPVSLLFTALATWAVSTVEFGGTSAKNDLTKWHFCPQT
jgi:hypothetical protein